MAKVLGFVLLCAVTAVREKDNIYDLKTQQLPCALKVKHGESVKDGESEAKPSFQIILECSEKVSDGRLFVPWLFKEDGFPLNIETDTIKAGEPIVIWGSQIMKKNEYYGVYGDHKSEEFLTYVGSMFKFTADYGAENTKGEVSVEITEAPAPSEQTAVTSPTMTAGDLPCELKLLDPKQEDVTIQLQCTEAVSQVVLQTPPGYNNVKFSQELAPNKPWTLMTLKRTPELEGQTFVVKAVPQGKSESANSNLLAFPGVLNGAGDEPTIDTEGFPCTLQSKSVKIQGGSGEGFSIVMKCTQKLLEVHLKLPNNYQDRYFPELAAGKDWGLATYPWQEQFDGNKPFWVEANLEDGTKVKSTEVFQPAK